MTELLFILTTIFVAYVIYVVVSEHKAGSPSETISEQPKETALPTVRKDPPPPAVIKPAEPAPIAAAATKPAAEAAPPVAEAEKSKRGIKNPKTGEIIVNYTNYRFAKRWLKEALVEEGLVDKIYKGDEITPEIEAKVKAAVAKMEAMAKYQA